jgi:3D (Asp-Asp-Asp) domain-containing protein
MKMLLLSVPFACVALTVYCLIVMGGMYTVAETASVTSYARQLANINKNAVTLRERHDWSFALLEEIFGQKVEPGQVRKLQVTATAYSARKAETNSQPWLTASGKLSRVGQLAVSRPMLKELGLQYGQVVFVKGMGLFTIRDTMNKRFDDYRIDLLMANKEAARRFGRRDVEIMWVVKEG